MKMENFDHKLAQECAKAFSEATGLGCMLASKEGQVYDEYGYGCTHCKMCHIAGLKEERRVQAHIYGMNEAERHGGKYIYFCPMGLTCFVSPILGDTGAEAEITVGPFIMVEKQDFIDCELDENPMIEDRNRMEAIRELEKIPVVPPQRVNQLSTLLFMAVGFMNNVAEENRMLESGRSEELQGQITGYIQQLKQKQELPPYPFETERELLRSIARQEDAQARRLLNILLGVILYPGAGTLELVKSRIYELLVLMSRTAIENGADGEHMLKVCHEYRGRIAGFDTFDSLCYWLSGVMSHFMKELFGYADAKHANVIHRCMQYIGTNYGQHISLEETAGMVYLSPSYLSRIFKKETGVSFNEYLNRVRINKAKELLQDRALRMTDIALMVGFEDQSYFTKVFKRVTGMLPKEYREKEDISGIRR